MVFKKNNNENSTVHSSDYDITIIFNDAYIKERVSEFENFF